jgi:hypothetical protein
MYPPQPAANYRSHVVFMIFKLAPPQPTTTAAHSRFPAPQGLGKSSFGSIHGALSPVGTVHLGATKLDRSENFTPRRRVNSRSA